MKERKRTDMGNFYGNIKVDNGTRRIGVNDDGEYIELSLADVTLFDRFASMIEWFEKKQVELAAYDADFKARHGENEDNTAAVIETVHKRTEVFSECRQKLDEVFGKGCCRKVFGDVIPDEVPIMDFLDQMTPIMSRMAQERGEKLRAKYRRPEKKQKQRTKEELIADYKARAAAKELTGDGEQV